MTTAVVLLVSTVLAVALALWIKKFVNRKFQIMQTVDIALAAMDFGSDVLFIVTAFSLNAEEGPNLPAIEASKADAAESLAWASLIFSSLPAACPSLAVS